jgi:predicted acyltransferase
MSTLPKRLLSIDVFRSITMFFMIFVNDLSGVKNVPKWIDHVEANADGLGFADTIFPAFLFIVGLSIPLALRTKQERGDSTSSILKYIGYRSFALVLMGFYHVNMENYDKQNWFPLPAWAITVTLSFFLIWLDYSPALNKKIKYTLIAIGYVTLIVMAFIYKGVPEEDETYTGMLPQWWGILGIIGWSYLFNSFIYFFSKGNLKSICLWLGGFMVLDILLHTLPTDFKFPILTDGSSAALTTGGIVVSILYSKYHNTINKRLYVPVIAGAVLMATGLIVRPYSGGISKIYSTPAWVLICMGISIIVYTLLAYLIDIKGKQNWFKIIRPAGTSTLTCYLFHYLIFFTMQWADFDYPDYFDIGTGGIIRSFAMSFFVIILVGLFEKARLRLKL